MLFCLVLACSNGTVNDPAYAEELARLHAAPERYDLRTVRACALLADDSPSFPSRLVFLYKTDPNRVDAQAELTQFDASLFRCGDVHLALPPRSDGTPVYMDFMPPATEVTIRELRVYRLGTAWDPEDPFALAAERHEPGLDYVFGVNLVSPSPCDPTILLVH